MEMRLPSKGRDHNAMAYCTWFAGGGNKSGTVRGATDAIDYGGVGDRHYCSGIHATIVNQMGLDHKKMR